MPDELATAPAAASIATKSVPVPLAIAEQQATVALELAAAPEDAPADHPLAALRGFRMEVEVVGPALPVRDLGRFLAAYVVVAAFVLGLIVVFIALTHVGSGGA